MRRVPWFAAVAVVVAVQSVAGTLLIPAPSVKVTSPATIATMTGGMSQVGATRFEDVALVCDCRLEDGRWALDASIRAIPHVFISNFKYLQHEMLHIFDFRSYLGEHIRVLSERRFESRKACDEHATAAALAFPETMKRVTRLSAAKRDGQRNLHSEDHLIVMQAKVVPELVDDRVTNLANGFTSAGSDAKNGAAKDGDLVGKSGQHVVASLGKRNPSVDAEQLVVVRTLAKRFEVFVTRFLLDDNHNVVQQPGKLVRQLVESFFHEVLEIRGA